MRLFRLWFWVILNSRQVKVFSGHVFVCLGDAGFNTVFWLGLDDAATELCFYDLWLGFEMCYVVRLS